MKKTSSFTDSLIVKKLIFWILLFLMIFLVITVSENLMNSKLKLENERLINVQNRESLALILNDHFLFIDKDIHQIHYIKDVKKIVILREALNEKISSMNKIIKILNEGGTYIYTLKVNLLEKDETSWPINYFPHRDELYDIDLLELAPKISSISELVEDIVESRLAHLRGEKHLCVHNLRLKKMDALLNRSMESLNKIRYRDNIDRNELHQKIIYLAQLFYLLKYILYFTSFIVLILAIVAFYKIFRQIISILREVQDSEKELNLILESMLFGVIIVGKDKIIKKANSFALKIMDKKVDDVVGKICHNNICPAQIDACPVIDLGRVEDISEKIILDSRGAEIPVLKSVKPIKLRGEEVLLETFVDIRKMKEAEKERDQMQGKLLEMSRQVGMSEVATGVLHNIGNILNSANISAEMIMEKLNPSLINKYCEVTGLLESNLNDLANFITNNENGKLLPKYYIEFAKHIKQNRNELIEEVQMLLENIENIKNIVSIQQSLAGKVGIIEDVELEKLVNQAINVNSVALNRHGVNIKKSIAPNIILKTDRLKILQILINLISNAKYAMKDNSTNDGKVISIVAKKLDANFIKIEIIDNGHGISDDTINKIFQYGFTTKDDGHGFGLHNSSLAAKELGGDLSVKSDGVGKGATFTLTLPLTRS